MSSLIPGPPTPMDLNVTLHVTTVGSTPACVRPSALSADSHGTVANAPALGTVMLTSGELFEEVYTCRQLLQLMPLLDRYNQLQEYMENMILEPDMEKIDWTELDGMAIVLDRLNAEFERVLFSSRTPSRSSRKRTFTLSSKEETSTVSSSAKRRMKTEGSTSML